MLGADVKWDGDPRTITITSRGNGGIGVAVADLQVVQALAMRRLLPMMRMFGKKEKTVEELQVPVFTVHTLPRDFELVCTVHAYASNSLSTKHQYEAHRAILEELGKEGTKAGADAVIGLFIHSQSTQAVLNAYGTAVRYK